MRWYQMRDKKGKRSFRVDGATECGGSGNLWSAADPAYDTISRRSSWIPPRSTKHRHLMPSVSLELAEYAHGHRKARQSPLNIVLDQSSSWMPVETVETSPSFNSYYIDLMWVNLIHLAPRISHILAYESGEKLSCAYTYIRSTSSFLRIRFLQQVNVSVIVSGR